MKILYFTIDNCDKCNIMRDYLNLAGIPYSEIKFKDLDSLSSTLKDKIYIVNAPILSINDTYYDEPCLFYGDVIRSDIADVFDRYMGD